MPVVPLLKADLTPPVSARFFAILSIGFTSLIDFTSYSNSLTSCDLPPPDPYLNAPTVICDSFSLMILPKSSLDIFNSFSSCFSPVYTGDSCASSKSLTATVPFLALNCALSAVFCALISLSLKSTSLYTFIAVSRSYSALFIPSTVLDRSFGSPNGVSAYTLVNGAVPEVLPCLSNDFCENIESLPGRPCCGGVSLSI